MTLAPMLADQWLAVYPKKRHVPESVIDATCADIVSYLFQGAKDHPTLTSSLLRSLNLDEALVLAFGLRMKKVRHEVRDELSKMDPYDFCRTIFKTDKGVYFVHLNMRRSRFIEGLDDLKAKEFKNTLAGLNPYRNNLKLRLDQIDPEAWKQFSSEVAGQSRRYRPHMNPASELCNLLNRGFEKDPYLYHVPKDFHQPELFRGENDS